MHTVFLRVKKAYMVYIILMHALLRSVAMYDNQNLRIMV